MPLDKNPLHYNDVIMTTMASEITSLTVVYSTVYSDADQRKHQSSASLAFVWEIHRDRWIPRTKGQLRGKCFHLMTSSWSESMMVSPLTYHFAQWDSELTYWGRNKMALILQTAFSNAFSLMKIYAIEISLKFVAKDPANNIPAMVHIMAWRRPGDMPFSEPTMVRLPSHISQWVNTLGARLVI